MPGLGFVEPPPPLSIQGVKLHLQVKHHDKIRIYQTMKIKFFAFSIKLLSYYGYAVQKNIRNCFISRNSNSTWLGLAKLQMSLYQYFLIKVRFYHCTFDDFKHLCVHDD